MKYDAIVARHNARVRAAYRRAALAEGIAIARSSGGVVRAVFSRDEARLREIKAEVDRTFAGDMEEMDAVMPIPGEVKS